MKIQLRKHNYKSCPECGCTEIDKIENVIENDGTIPENAYVCMNESGCGCEFLYTEH